MSIIFEKARELPEPLHSFFWNDEPRFICEDICFLYGVPEESIGEVSWFVAPLLVKSLPPANLPQELHAKLLKLPEGVIFGLAFELNRKILQKFPGQFPEAVSLLSEWERKKSKPILSEGEAHKKTLEVEAWYLDWKRENEQEEKSAPQENVSQTVSLPLLDALAKYQRLSEQTVTEDRLVVKGESVPVRGSVRNWLRNYRDSVGIRKHSTVERGQFLFQSENTKRLESAECERLSLVLRSLDENTPVSIDVERQEIVFPAFEEKGSASLAPSEGVSVPALETSFRPLEKFPAAQTPIRKALEWDAKSAERMPLSGTVPAPTAPAPRAKETVISNSSLSSGGNISFSSSHVLPSEKENNSQKESHQYIPEPEAQGLPEAISIIRPRGNQRDFRGGVGSDGGSADDSFDAPRVVDLRNPGGIPNDKF